jgi:hypothetical protein
LIPILSVIKTKSEIDRTKPILFYLGLRIFYLPDLENYRARYLDAKPEIVLSLKIVRNFKSGSGGMGMVILQKLNNY